MTRITRHSRRRRQLAALGALAAIVAIGTTNVGGQRPAPRPVNWPTTVDPAPDRRAGEGEGPYERLVIRGVTVIDGTGGPARGPMDIVIERNRIVEMRDVGTPGLPIRPERRPARGTREIDAEGMYVLPGFVDLHAHVGRAVTGAPAEFVYKLWLAHGVTTVREAGSMNGIDWTLREKARSAANQIVAPRIFAYTVPNEQGQPVGTVAEARAFVRAVAAKGVDGLKLGLATPASDPEIMAALIDEAKALKLGTTAHLAPTGVTRMNALAAARIGLGSLEHWYGLPESVLAGRTVQEYPDAYNYNNEIDRFVEAGRLWKQTVPLDSEKWKAVRDELIKLRFTLDPTMTVYEKARDAAKAMRQEWMDRYMLPSQWRAWMPNRELHGAYFARWTTRDENEWRRNFQIWMSFLNDYKNHGGRVTTGSDSSGPFEQFGFRFIREIELLQEAGFSPLEAFRSATLNGAETLHEPKGTPIAFGIVRPGLLADLVIVPENPLVDTKVLYATGALRADDVTGETRRVGGVRYTIKDGIVYDGRALLADVARLVEQAKSRGETITFPH